MGDRAVITTRAKRMGVYVHWDGDREHIEAFLAFCKASGFRAPERDNYGWAYLGTVIGNYFGDGLSVGIDELAYLDCDNWDNGVYVIANWEIVGREYFHGEEPCDGPSLGILRDINERQPEHMRLTDEKLREVANW